MKQQREAFPVKKRLSVLCRFIYHHDRTKQLSIQSFENTEQTFIMFFDIIISPQFLYSSSNDIKMNFRANRLERSIPHA